MRPQLFEADVSHDTYPEGPIAIQQQVVHERVGNLVLLELDCNGIGFKRADHDA